MLREGEREGRLKRKPLDHSFPLFAFHDYVASACRRRIEVSVHVVRRYMALGSRWVTVRYMRRCIMIGHATGTSRITGRCTQVTSVCRWGSLWMQSTSYSPRNPCARIVSLVCPLSRDDEYPAVCPAFFICFLMWKTGLAALFLVVAIHGLAPRKPGHAPAPGVIFTGGSGGRGGALMPRGLPRGSSIMYAAPERGEECVSGLGSALDPGPGAGRPV
jgi:hypothetical protein